MKWLKNIFEGKKPGEEAVSLQLSTKLIPGWRREGRNPDLQCACREIYGRIEDVAKALSKDISALVSAERGWMPRRPSFCGQGLAARGEVVKAA